jgi:hypothetical protein
VVSGNGDQMQGQENKKTGTENERTEAAKKYKNYNPYSAELGSAVNLNEKLFFEKSEWLNTVEAAVYLRKFLGTGCPSVNAIHKLVSQGKIRRRKFAGRLYFKRKELDYLIESSTG